MPSKGKFRIWHLLEYIAQRNKEVNMRAIEGLRYGLKGLQNMPGGKKSRGIDYVQKQFWKR